MVHVKKYVWFVKLKYFLLAELQAYIVIKNSYPNPPPIIALSLNYKKKHNSGNSDEIRVIY